MFENIKYKHFRVFMDIKIPLLILNQTEKYTY